MNSAAIETPVTEPMVISTRLGGMVSVCAPGRRQQRHQVARLGAALLHLREQHRRDRRHVGRLGARDAGDQIHRADQHVVTARRGHGRAGWPGSATMARAMPVISISRPRKTNSGTDEQDEVRHALVHAADDDRLGVLVVSAR